MNLELQQGRTELCRDRRLDKRDYPFIEMDFFKESRKEQEREAESRAWSDRSDLRLPEKLAALEKAS